MCRKARNETSTHYLNYGTALMMDVMAETMQGRQIPGKSFSTAQNLLSTANHKENNENGLTFIKPQKICHFLRALS